MARHAALNGLERCALGTAVLCSRKRLEEIRCLVQPGINPQSVEKIHPRIHAYPGDVVLPLTSGGNKKTHSCSRFAIDSQKKIREAEGRVEWTGQ